MLDINDPAHWALTVKAMKQVRAFKEEQALLEAIFDGAPTKQNLLDLWQISCDSFEDETRRVLQVAIELHDFLFCPPTLPTILSLEQFALNCWRQPRQIVFHDVVVSAHTHRRNRRLLSDRAGDDNERNIPVLLTDQLECIGNRKLWQVIVGQHYIPAFISECFAKLLLVFNPLHLDVVCGAAQFPRDEKRVVRRVLNVQDVQCFQLCHHAFNVSSFALNVMQEFHVIP